MTFKYLKPFFLIPALCLIGCSEQNGEAPPVTKAYVTNAEYVYKAIKNNKTSGLAFQVKPIRTSACEYMYIEFGKRDSDGKWAVTNSVHPGKDNRNNFGQDKLMDQIHFVEVDGQGEFGVLGLGCKPYGREMNVSKGLLATFNVDYGRLNYVGEIALIPVEKRFTTISVADRAEFAKEQIQSQLPDLGTFFQNNIMEKYAPKLSKEQQAALDAMDARRKAMQPVLDMRNQVAGEYNLTVKEWNDWLEKYGGRNNENKTADAERKSLKIFKRKEALEDRLELHDKFIDEGRGITYVKKYISLLDDYEKKKAARDNKTNTDSSNAMYEAADAHDTLLTFKKNNP